MQDVPCEPGAFNSGGVFPEHHPLDNGGSQRIEGVNDLLPYFLEVLFKDYPPGLRPARFMCTSVRPPEP
jgi:hypothetical protein